MNEAHSREAQEHAAGVPQSTFLDEVFETHRVIKMAMCASVTGMAILLGLAYLLRDTNFVLHLCILAAIMLVLFVLLAIYKAIIANDPHYPYYPYYPLTQHDPSNRHHPKQDLDHDQEQDDEDDNGSDSSSLVEVIPHPKQGAPGPKPEHSSATTSN